MRIQFAHDIWESSPAAALISTKTISSSTIMLRFIFAYTTVRLLRWSSALLPFYPPSSRIIYIWPSHTSAWRCFCNLLSRRPSLYARYSSAGSFRIFLLTHQIVLKLILCWAIAFPITIIRCIVLRRRFHASCCRISFTTFTTFTPRSFLRPSS